VRRSDLLVGVDEVNTLDVPLDQVQALLRGPVGSKVRLDVERAGRRVRFDVTRTPE
jgi:C-terminal processing protease CtpA/Prc